MEIATACRGTVNLIPLSLPLAYGDRDPRDVSETMVATGRGQILSESFSYFIDKLIRFQYMPGL